MVSKDVPFELSQPIISCIDFLRVVERTARSDEKGTKAAGPA
jgi:hypothetical protein